MVVNSQQKQRWKKTKTGFTKNTLKDQYNEYIKSFIRWEVKNFAWLAVNHMRPSINSTIQSINQSINQSISQSIKNIFLL